MTSIVAGRVATLVVTQREHHQRAASSGQQCSGINGLCQLYRPQITAGREFFTAPAQVNQRRYEALRAYYTEDLTLAAAGERFGYTRSTMASLVRDFRAGRLELFTPPGKPGRKGAPATDRARGRVIELRRQGLSVHEISRKLAAEETPLNRTGVGHILTEEGFGRLLRGPARFASVNPATAGRDTRLPRVATIDFTQQPDTANTSMAGLLLLLPDLLTLDLPSLVTAAGYPRHPNRARHQLDLLAARLETDQHPTRLPRR